jgi:hypothetical protein
MTTCTYPGCDRVATRDYTSPGKADFRCLEHSHGGRVKDTTVRSSPPVCEDCGDRHSVGQPCDPFEGLGSHDGFNPTKEDYRKSR